MAPVPDSHPVRLSLSLLRSLLRPHDGGSTLHARSRCLASLGTKQSSAPTLIPVHCPLAVAAAAAAAVALSAAALNAVPVGVFAHHAAAAAAAIAVAAVAFVAVDFADDSLAAAAAVEGIAAVVPVAVRSDLHCAADLQCAGLHWDGLQGPGA